MDAAGILQILIYLAVITALTPLLGGYMAKVYEGQARFLGPVERGLYKMCGVDTAREQHWTGYALSLLAFNLAGWALLFGLQRLQGMLPLNPAEMAAVPPDLAFNTAISFMTNTNWQSYGGESTLSYLTQMVGLTVQNFVSAATGMAVLVALIRGFARANARTVGNFYVDLVRTTLYILLPLSFVAALFLVWQGMPQNFEPYTTATTLEGANQVIAQGPVASQVAIKQLGSNGGGFFNVNSSHPFENPTPLSNIVEMTFLLMLAAALTNTFGRMVKDQRQGWAIFAAMGLMLVIGLGVATWAETHANPAMVAAGMDYAMGNMEGKEVRFGIANSAIWATATTAASNGSVNSMHDSFMPLGGLVPMVNMLLGEVIFGGVGAGLYGMLIFVIVAVFIAGLMVGRTPEYLGKKIEAKEVKLAMLALLVFPISVLGLGAASLLGAPGAIQDSGPHGLSEVLYAFASATGNNGSAFAGWTGNTLLNNSLMGAALLLGRFVVIIPALAIAGAVVAKKVVPPSAGTFPTHGWLFVVLLVGVIAVVGGLTFFPVLALGPIVEHLMLGAGTLF
ncbi:potassium-transporting ATPase subunit KdpA [Magnetospirillum aberrantis]|uniref:Potassium-transporting ATPase potassium-binding subunit n=1 Tax=Magnetospirillum aberrantis SpK TaxID=908842 RepID=A0A7C9UXJ4_9PROT|nr:potassium-transporting ATPase subunit KdpA [Magnetospirillum aberrantis]NFV78934.1 potassium-transporting ATPase subunit KdpA [Magnetospirillum aberrantis SpK]